MPIHDWTRVRANRFHDFRLGWIARICDALNNSLLPAGYYAMIERRNGTQPFTVDMAAEPRLYGSEDSPPNARHVIHLGSDSYPKRTDRVTIRKSAGALIAVIEIIIPGDKSNTHAMRDFTRNTTRMLRKGIHALVIDVFPPNPRNPLGVHRLIADRFGDEDFLLPQAQQLCLAAYHANGGVTAYVEPVSVGDTLPDMPVFLDDGVFIPCPLETAYQKSYAVFPAVLKTQLEAAVPPA